MKIALFDAKNYDKPSFDRFGGEQGVEIKYFEAKLSEDTVKAALDAFSEGDEYGMILRAKGIVQGTDGAWIHFDYVPGEPDVRHGSADVIGRLCVIGADLDREALSALFGAELK